jgi:hypothetical protein
MDNQLSESLSSARNCGTSGKSLTGAGGEDVCYVPRVDSGSTKRPAPIPDGSSSDADNDASTPDGPGSSKSDCTNEESMSSKSCSTSVSSVSTQNDEEESHEKATKRPKGSKPKKDRSKLRKGKWTVGSSTWWCLDGASRFRCLTFCAMVLIQVEEEEYTSRIIHYFISGLLTLPEGATLRSYLADKLNCDPMRITKKYAGASCLGRRVYHFRDRVHPTVRSLRATLSSAH